MKQNLLSFYCRHGIPIQLIIGETGLVVTRASCYSCIFSKTRRQQEFLVISNEKHIKPTLHAKFLFWPKNWFLPLRVFVSHIFENSPSAKKYPTTSGNWQKRKMKYNCSIYWWNYYCLVCMGVWLTGTSSKKIPWGKLLQFSWGEWNISKTKTPLTCTRKRDVTLGGLEAGAVRFNLINATYA